MAWNASLYILGGDEMYFLVLALCLNIFCADPIAIEAEAHGIDPVLVKAIIQIESGGDANAVGDNGASIGLMQIQPRWHGWRLNEGEDLKDPRVNARVGGDILQELLYKYNGDIAKALTVYNKGHDDGSRDYYNKVCEEMEIIDRYGNPLVDAKKKPTVAQAINSWSLLQELAEIGYCHNWQLERRDIAEYIQSITQVVDKAYQIIGEEK